MRPTVITAVLAALTIVSCSAPETAVRSAVPTASQTSTPPPATVRTITASLNAQLGFNAHGTVRVDIQENGYVLSVIVSGLLPDQVHLVNTHAGSCAHQDTRVIMDLAGAPVTFGNRMMSDGGGNAMLSQQYPGRKFTIPAEGRILTVHGPFGSDDLTTHIACADLTN